MPLQDFDYVRFTCPHCGKTTETQYLPLKVAGLGSCIYCHRRIPDGTPIRPVDPDLAAEYREAEDAEKKMDETLAKIEKKIDGCTGVFILMLGLPIALLSGVVYFIV